MHGKALKKHLRHVLLWLFDKNNEITGTVAAQKMQVYGEDAMKEWACRKWLKRFREGEKDLDDLEVAGLANLKTIREALNRRRS